MNVGEEFRIEVTIRYQGNGYASVRVIDGRGDLYFDASCVNVTQHDVDGIIARAVERALAMRETVGREP